MTGGDREFAGLVGQAWELRNTPYALDACEAIADWVDRQHVRDLERRQPGNAQLVRVLRPPPLIGVKLLKRAAGAPIAVRAASFLARSNKVL